MATGKLSKEDKILMFAYAGIVLAYGLMLYVKYKHLKQAK